jgi:hypothetical protein
MKINKVYLSLAFISLFSILLWISSCRHDTLLPPNTPEICFDRDVLLIIQPNCSMLGCHDGTGETRPLNIYTDIKRGVTPFNPNTSAIYQAIIGKSGEGKMPPDKPLSLENRTIIRIWIEQGANETHCDTVPAVK